MAEAILLLGPGVIELVIQTLYACIGSDDGAMLNFQVEGNGRLLGSDVFRR